MENTCQPNMPVPVSPSAVSAASRGADYDDGYDRLNHLRDHWNILLKRKWWVIGTFLSAVITVGLITFSLTPSYRSASTLQITQDNPASIMGERDPLMAMAGQDSLTRFYETQYLILSSRPMAYRIIESLNLADHPDYQILREQNPEKSPVEINSIIADAFLKKLEVRPKKRSYLVDVAFESDDKRLAQQVPNAIAQEYVKFSMNTRQQSYALIKEWLEKELQQLGSKVEASEAKLYQHGQKKDFLSLEGKDNVIVGKYVDLNMLLTKAQSERAVREAQYRQIKEKGLDAPLITNNLLVQKLREEAIAQEAKVSGINKIYDANYPQLQAEQAKLTDLRSRLNHEVQRIGVSIEADYEVALRAENLLREAMASQKTQVVDLQNNLVQHHILKRDMQTNEQLYQALLARMKEASVASTMVASNVAMIAPAEVPLKPYKPSKRYNLGLAAFFGLLGGVALAFAVEYFDDSIKTTEELERICRAPVLGVVPLWRQDRKKDLEAKDARFSMLDQPNSMVAEAIRHVRTSVMLSCAGRPPGRIMVTSPNPGEGKTTLSINLAIAIAMSRGKVLLIDGDLRKPSVHRAFHKPGEPGLSNYLSGNAQVSEIVYPTESDNLFFIPAGTVPPNPTELTGSRAFTELLAELQGEFQHLIIDTPPIIGFADARALSSLMDAVLVVIRHHSTTRAAGQLTRQLLLQSHSASIGVVLNMVESRKMGYNGYYKYYDYYNSYYQLYHNNGREDHK